MEYYLIFIAIILLIILGNKFIQKKSGKSGAYQKLAQMGLLLHKRAGNFGLDIKHQKWIILVPNDVHVHDYKDFIHAELWENGRIYQMKDKNITDVEGNIFSPDANAAAKQGVVVEQLELHISSSHPRYPEETVSFIKGKLNSKSGLYFDCAHQAQLAMRLLDAIREYNEPAPAEDKTEKAEDFEYVFDAEGRLVKQKKNASEEKNEKI